MFALTAFCTSCGFTFPFNSPIAIDPRRSRNFTFSGNTTDCVRCGGIANISDFVIDARGNTFIKDVYSSLSQSGISSADFQRLLEIIRQGEQQKASPTQVAENIRQNVPAASGIAQHLQNAANIAGVLSLLVALISLFISLRPQSTSGSSTNNQARQPKVEQQLSPDSPKKKTEKKNKRIKARPRRRR